MDKLDYSKINNISLKNDGLLSSYSDGVIKFIYYNKIKTEGL